MWKNSTRRRGIRSGVKSCPSCGGVCCLSWGKRSVPYESCTPLFRRSGCVRTGLRACLVARRLKVGCSAISRAKDRHVPTTIVCRDEHASSLNGPEHLLHVCFEYVEVATLTSLYISKVDRCSCCSFTTRAQWIPLIVSSQHTQSQPCHHHRQRLSRV